MSADLELLQRAEALIRERATTAAGSPWQSIAIEDEAGSSDSYVISLTGFTSIGDDVGEGMTAEDAEHIASWDPVVALAVADTVHQAAVDLWAHGPLCCAEGCMDCDDNHWMPYARKALTLARTYLKES